MHVLRRQFTYLSEFKRETRYILYVCRYTCPLGQVISKRFLLASNFHIQDFQAPDSRTLRGKEINLAIAFKNIHREKEMKNNEIVACGFEAAAWGRGALRDSGPSGCEGD